jgi:uncharacterized protein (DUF488 family)
MDVVRTVGHGTLGAEELVAFLRPAGVEAIADIRRYPGSRRHPHVAREAMEQWLPAAGIRYEWIVELGGRRPLLPDSRHVALRDEQFRGYADHMASAEFAAGLDRLGELAGTGSVAVMCSESVWWRCHRRLLADHLTLLDATPVEHLFHDGRRTAHEPAVEARVEDGALVYDVVDQPTLFDA